MKLWQILHYDQKMYQNILIMGLKVVPIIRLQNCNVKPLRKKSFLQKKSYKTQHVFNNIMKVLEKNSIEIRNSWSQLCDDVSSMNGNYNGLQSKITYENKLSTLVTWAAYFLN